MRVLAGVGVLSVLAVAPISGQSLYSGGIVAAALLDGIAINTQITDDHDDAHCAFGSRLLEAEAERTLRRDGVVTRPDSPARLSIEVIMLPEFPRRCAASVNIELVVVVDARLEVIWLAAQGGRLLVWPSPEHVGRIRETVEENVSVIANAIRRARDDVNPR